MDQGPTTLSSAIDPADFFETLFGVPRPWVESDVPPQMLASVDYGDGTQASPNSTATFTLQYQGFAPSSLARSLTW